MKDSIQYFTVVSGSTLTMSVIPLHLLVSMPVPRALQIFVTGCCFDATSGCLYSYHSAGIFLSFLVVEILNLTPFSG